MYNMRYHLASLIAVFLALSIGLLLGGLITDRTPENIQDALLDGIERDIAQTRETNERLLAENVIAYDFSDMLLENFVEGKLEGLSIIVLGEDGQSLQSAIGALEDAGAEAIHMTPAYSADFGTWGIQDLLEVQEIEFQGIVNTFEPRGDGEGYLSDYLVYLREIQDYYEVPLICATIDSSTNELVSYAWEEGFSGTNQLGNRYGAYTLIVLLSSDTEGKFGSTANAFALYPPIPEEFFAQTSGDVYGEGEAQ